MVGRERELETLRETFERATGGPASVLVTIVGVPGVGKSRLAREFLNGLPEATTVVRGRCLSYGEGITYWPIVEILTGDRRHPRLGRSRRDPGEDLRRSSKAPATGRSPRSGSRTSSGWRARRLHPRRRTGRSGSSSKRWPPTGRSSRCSRTSTGRNPGLLDLIEHVAEWTQDAPILLVCTSRPELRDDRPDWGRQVTGHDDPSRSAV